MFVGATIAIVLFVLAHWTSEKVREMTERIDQFTQQKAKAEQKNKADNCKIIIGELQGIQHVDQSLITYVNGYKVGVPDDKLILQGMALDSSAKSGIYNMNDAIGELHGV